MNLSADGAAQAVLLAGGRGRRLGGRDKAMLLRDGRPLLLHWQEALQKRRIPFAVVGPDHLRQTLGPAALLTQEAPAWGGPAAAVRAGALALGEQREWTMLLAVDVVDSASLLDWLLEELTELEQSSGAAGGPVPDALVPQDGEQRLQYLGAAVRSASLRRRAESFTDARIEGLPLRVLLDGFGAVHPAMPEGLGEDVDTPQDAGRHRIRLS